MLAHLLVLLAGVVLAAVGGELFVRGTVGLAAWLTVPAGLVAVSVTAFATSAPELSVGLQAAWAGRPELALGDALGSNVVNITAVLGIVLLAGPLPARRSDLRRDLSVAAAAPLLTLVALADGRLVRAEAVVLLAVFLVWLGAVGSQAWRERSAVEDVLGERRGWPVVRDVGAGLVCLVVAGRLVVTAAQRIGVDLGLDPFVVGATVVAMGTSTPEIATALVARRRGHSEVGVGTVLGSNVFNTLWVVGLVALIAPVRATASEVVASIVACVVALGLAVPTAAHMLPRRRGPLLLALGAGYGVVTVALGR